MGIDFGGWPEKMDYALTRYGFVVTPLVGIHAVAAKVFTNIFDQKEKSTNPDLHGRYWNYCRERDGWETAALFVPILGSLYLLGRDRMQPNEVPEGQKTESNLYPVFENNQIKLYAFTFDYKKVNEDEYQCEGRTYSRAGLIRHARQQALKKIREDEMS
jgi:hypothetical protein